MGHTIADQGRLWPAGIVPYEIDAAFAPGGAAADPKEQSPLAIIAGTIEEWNQRTILRLIPWTGQTDYLIFAPSDEVSQSEYVGRNGGAQRIQLDFRRARALGRAVGGSAQQVVVHEIGHAIGLLHEHLRSDRDDYVTVRWDNVDPDRLCGFCVRGEDPGCDQCEPLSGRAVGPYDYGSVMHYFATQGAVDSAEPTLVPVTISAAGRQPIVRQLGCPDGLSVGDIATIKAVYEKSGTHPHRR